ncbi:MAG: hypothetical protein JWO41_772 [Candidatus Saccharibacteria bacterium]|nr:hypothetical protein [Candidatus Saccharibacteria bacterium]
MSLKYRIVISGLSLSVLLGLGGYAIKNPFVMIAGIVFLAFSLGCLFFADKQEKRAYAIIIDGIFWGII